MEAKDKANVQQGILRKFPGTDPNFDLDWDMMEITWDIATCEERERIVELLSLYCNYALQHEDFMQALKKGVK